MPEALEHVLNFLKAHEAWAGPVLCLLAAFESLAVIGAFAPLTASLISVGAAIAAGVFSPSVLVWIMAGCAAGNGISYEGGAWTLRRGLGANWIPVRPRQATEALFRRHGAVAVVVARFLGPPSSVAPFLAGWSGMPRPRFWLANLTVCVVWPPAMAAIGFAGLRAFGR
jgi:membrane protein DedA with SNARE-associated domain